MRAGKLRHLLTVQELSSASTSLDSRGQQSSPTWTRVAKVRGSIMPLRGREGEQARQQFATATHMIRSRYVPNIDEQCRIQWNGRTFHIQEIRNLEEINRELEIVATEEKP